MLVTVEELLNKGKSNNKNNKFKVYITELDREIEVKTLCATDYLEIMSSSTVNKPLEIVYNCCDIFKDERLIQQFNCKFNPAEVVDKILSYATIYHLANVILEKSNILLETPEKFIKVMEDDIKN